jgi:diacylglycerol O-acyltransferase
VTLGRPYDTTPLDAAADEGLDGVVTRSRLSSQDALWLTMDRPNSLMVIDAVMWFAGTAPDWDAVDDVVQERLVDRYPVFHRRPIEDDGVWYWEDDPSFDLARHVRRIGPDEPGAPDDLAGFVASQRSVPLERDRPLWSMFYLDRVLLSDGSYGAAVVARLHHAIADGVRLVQVTLGMCDLTETSTPAQVGRALRRSTTPVTIASSAVRNVTRSAADVFVASAESAANALSGALDTAQAAAAGEVNVVLERVTDAGDRATTLASSLLRNPERVGDLAEAMSSEDNRVVNDVTSVSKLAMSNSSVRTVWSGTPGVAKSASIAPAISLDDVKAIGRATATTVNDVLMATVAGALTRYLREHGDPEVDEVMWMVPVSVKPVEVEPSPDLGNHFALVVLRMPIGADDVRDRLAAVHRSMERIKRSDEALLTYSIQRAISKAPRTAATALTNYFANKAVGVLTNVPGPGRPMTLAGTEVSGMLGWAP